MYHKPSNRIDCTDYLFDCRSFFQVARSKEQKQSFIRQQQQASLVGAVLEYIRGISVIKAFNITGERAVKLTDAIDSTCKNAIQYEAQSMIPTIVYKTCFCLGSLGSRCSHLLWHIRGVGSSFCNHGYCFYIFNVCSGPNVCQYQQPAPGYGSWIKPI